MKDLTQVATICQRGGGGVERDEKVYSLFTALAPHCCCKNKKNRLPLGCIWLKLLSFSPTATEAERAKVTTLTENIPVPEAADRI
jgi:hypothetical protein